MGFAPPPPPSNPYPSAPLETLDQHRLDRMAKQARELSDWVGSNEGAGPVHHVHRTSLVRASSGERPEQGDEGRRSDRRSTLMPEGVRHNGGRRGYSHERPPLMHPIGNGSSGNEDTMQRMREAEERLSFARRVKDANYELADPREHYQTRLEQPPTTVIDYSSYNEPTPIHPPQALAFVPPPPPRSRQARDPSPPSPQHHQIQDESLPELVISAPAPALPAKRKASSATAAKPKAAPRASTSTAPPLNDTEFDTDPALNPAPFSTPANIPPSPFPPPPRAARPRPSHSTSTSASTSTSTPVPTTLGGKPALLSAEQKKANHIASEQKRRAAIRQGYEALCTVVPSLKAAVEEFEERVKKLGGTGGGRAGKKRRGSGGAAMAGPLSGGIEVGGEKVDGRAGPKSEAVVLGKSQFSRISSSRVRANLVRCPRKAVEHLRNLLTERQARLERLSSLYQLAEDSDVEIEGGRRVWEEHWDGGPVLTGNAAEEVEDGEEDDM